jgi:hypothetical protein
LAVYIDWGADHLADFMPPCLYDMWLINQPADFINYFVDTRPDHRQRETGIGMS